MVFGGQIKGVGGNVPWRLEECGTLTKRLAVGLNMALAWPELDTHAGAARSDAHL